MGQTEKYSAYSFLLDRTAKRVKQYAQSKFRELNFDITVDQWVIMKNLYQKGSMNQKELAEMTFKDHPTMTRIIDLLCQKGLCERTVHPSDRRSFIISLTEEGQSKTAQLLPEISQIRNKAWENLNEEDFESFKRILNTIYDNLS
jgi:DNA-binding MarR family transcriptional regulator